MSKMKISVILFITVSLLSGWIGVAVDAILPDQPQGNSLGMGLWLVLPFLVGIILRAIMRNWDGYGARPRFKGNLKWYLVSLLIYPTVTLLAIAAAMLLRQVDLSSFELNTFLSVAVVSMAGSMVKNIFEEFSWRGVLTPMLLALKLNDWLIYLISGLVWSLWHAAYYLVFLPDIYFVSISRLGTIMIGSVLMCCWTIMFVEIYRLTQSVWPCVLMHAVEDAIPTVLVTTGGFIAFTNVGDLWLNPVSGIVSTALFLAIGLVLRSTRIKQDKGALLNAEALAGKSLSPR